MHLIAVMKISLVDTTIKISIINVILKINLVDAIMQIYSSGDIILDDIIRILVKLESLIPA